MNKHMEAPGYRPVLRGNPIFFPDVQGRLPVGWCQDCGSEVFEPNRLLCRRCQKAEQYNPNTPERVSDLLILPFIH